MVLMLNRQSDAYGSHHSDTGGEEAKPGGD